MMANVHSPAQTNLIDIVSDTSASRDDHLNLADLIDEGVNESNRDNNQSSPVTVTNTSAAPTRIPGTYPPEWLPDHEADSCMSCQAQFTIIKRRHHCRSCGKIFCCECCGQKGRLLYMDNKEARVCNNCYHLLEFTISSLDTSAANTSLDRPSGNSFNNPAPQASGSTSSPKVHGVLKNSNQARSTNEMCNNSSLASTSSSSCLVDQNQQQHQLNKQVMFADGIRPGTDLTESFPYPVPDSAESSSSSTFSLLTRQNSNRQHADPANQTQKRISKKSLKENSANKNITVCDELGYLPPIVLSNNQVTLEASSNTSSNSIIRNLIAGQLNSTKKTLQASMESRSCPLNGIIKFEQISSLVGVNDVVTFLLLKEFYLKVKLVTKTCCLGHKEVVDEMNEQSNIGIMTHSQAQISQDQYAADDDHVQQYWCFTSEGLSRFGQDEIVLIIDKDKDDSCIPRDVFKIYLTLHELALRRQSLENLGNLLFQDGLFGSRDTAGLLFVKPLQEHCLKNLVLPQNNKTFLIAIVLQRWEVPWSKVFPMRLLLRLGHKFQVYPYPIISFRIREPVYYEVGHTIISILGDFRNFRYSLTHVDGLKVMFNRATKKVSVKLNQSCYTQFNKVLESSNNEHVLAWSSCPFPEADAHMVSVQNDDGQYETVEFYNKNKKRKTSSNNLSFEDLDDGNDKGQIFGASFIIFSGALKVNQSGQSAKISIVEDGLLIQIQSCTMFALRNAIHFMHQFDIDCENDQDPLTKVEIDWQLEDNSND